MSLINGKIGNFRKKKKEKAEAFLKLFLLISSLEMFTKGTSP